MSGLTHLDGQGRAHMVDVTGKPETVRTAVARGTLAMAPETLAMVMADELPKGDVIGTARIAGIMAAKRTADLIPLCHPLPLTAIAVEIEPESDGSGLAITATCTVTGRTGVEMEALTAAVVAGLTLYDMAKAVDKGMRLTEFRLAHKSGGKSGRYDEPTDTPAR